MEFGNNNDIFFEQIVAIKKSGKDIFSFFVIWFFAVILIALAVLFLGSFGLLIAVGIGYGAWWLSSKLNVEFEYIITNGTMDIDKIINKSSRKRITSFELPGVTKLEKYSPAKINNIDKKNVIFACNETDPNAYLMTVNRQDKGAVNLIFAPNAKIKSAVEKFAPKFITNRAFKD